MSLCAVVKMKGVLDAAASAAAAAAAAATTLDV